MRIKYLIILFSLCFGNALAQETKSMPNLDPDFPDVDTLIHHKDYLLHVNVDTLYIINKEGVLSYKMCRDSYDALRKETEQIIHLKSIIENVDKEFGLLNKNLNALENKYEISLNENIKTNQFLKSKNSQIESELQTAKDNLRDARQKIKSEKWNSKTSKIIWGVGGALIGGTLIMLSK